MAVVLKTNPQSMILMADELERKITDIQKQFSDMENKIYRTQAFWEGEASTVHLEAFEGLRGEIDEVLNRLKSNPHNLLVMAEIYKNNEMSLTQFSQPLSDDVIV